MDRISELPQPILHHILFFMSAKDAASTIVLSKSWSITWSTFKNDFTVNEEVFLKRVPSAKREDFKNWVGKTLSKKNKIEIFKLSMNLSNDEDTSYVDNWIELVTTNHNIEVLVLDIAIITGHGYPFRIFKEYSLPNITNVAKSIDFLGLKNCRLRWPLLCYSIKDLSLTSVSVPHNQIVQNLLSSCILLQSFNIKDCKGVDKVRVFNHLNLKVAKTKGVFKVEIEAAPNLEKLEYTNYCGGLSNLKVIECNNLKELSLESVMSGQVIQQLVSKFPLLETLKLKLSSVVKRLKISSVQLKHLTLLATRCEILDELEIDSPNLCSYEYSGMVIPSLFSINTSGLQYVAITLKPHRMDIYNQWLIQLRKYLVNFKQIDCFGIIGSKPS